VIAEFTRPGALLVGFGSALTDRPLKPTLGALQLVASERRRSPRGQGRAIRARTPTPEWGGSLIYLVAECRTWLSHRQRWLALGMARTGPAATNEEDKMMTDTVELQVAYGTVYRRIPTLRLAVELDQIPFKHDVAAYGVCELPVTW
jgi:hypothetical protein